MTDPRFCMAKGQFCDILAMHMNTVRIPALRMKASVTPHFMVFGLDNHDVHGGVA